jgi:hypothetical protein
MNDATQPHHLPEQLGAEPPIAHPKSTTLKRFLPALITGIAGLAIGAALSVAVLAPPLAEATGKVEQLTSDLDRTESDLSNAQSFNKELLAAAEEVDKTAEELAAREAAVKEREDAVTATENTIASNSFGEGMYVVGVDVAAGVYRNEGAAGCYYAWMSSSASDSDIVDNELTDGPATVTLRDGENFKSNRCGTWTKIG